MPNYCTLATRSPPESPDGDERNASKELEEVGRILTVPEETG